MAASLIFYIKNHLYTFLYNVQHVLRSIPLYVNPYGSFGPLRKTKYFLKKSVSFIFFFFFFIFFFVFHILFNGNFGPRLVFFNYVSFLFSFVFIFDFVFIFNFVFIFFSFLYFYLFCFHFYLFKFLL